MEVEKLKSNQGELDDHSAEGGGEFKMPKFNDYMKPRKSFESFSYYERNKRNSMTPGSCPSTSQNELLKTQVDMFGFGSFEDEDYFSMKTPNIDGSEFSMSRDNSYQSPNHGNKPGKVKRARKTTWYGG
jgi:hypothetical protein